MMLDFKQFEIDNERAFPSYTVAVRFQMDGKPPEGWTRSVVEGKPERQWSSSQRMSPLAYEAKPDFSVVQADAQKFWDEVKDQVHGPKSYGPEGTPKFPNVSDVEIKIGEEKWETWIEGWFSHWTWRLDRTDAELLASFEKYVRRVREQCNYDSEKYGGRLMGAEDRYRWKGDGRTGTEAPCNCEHCVKLGITRIDH